MNFAERLFQSQFVKETHKTTLSGLLERNDFSWLVGTSHAEEARLQGDLFQALPIVLIDAEGNVRKTSQPAMVINNTCDLQPDRSTFVTVALTSSYAAFSEFIGRQRNLAGARGYLESLRRNEIDELLFIPSCPGFLNGAVVHLDRLCSMSTRVYEGALFEGGRLASFSQYGFYYLLMKVTHFLARAESPDVAPRTVPST
jgi:hypothetical protein